MCLQNKDSHWNSEIKNMKRKILTKVITSVKVYAQKIHTWAIQTHKTEEPAKEQMKLTNVMEYPDFTSLKSSTSRESRYLKIYVKSKEEHSVNQYKPSFPVLLEEMNKRKKKTLLG